MKKIFLIGSFCAALLFATSCEQGFDQLNVNPNSPTALNPVLLLNNGILSSAYPGGDALVFEAGIVQQIISPNGTVLAGANFNVDNKPRNAANWNNYFQNANRHLVDVIEQTRTNANRSNLYHSARIWRANVMMILTDTYGDIPYTEAGLGYLEGIAFPKYDKQEAIYTDIIKELTEAAAGLDAAKTRETGEIMYQGDVVKWRRLAFSLMLRAGMRLSAVNPTLAQQIVQRAVTGGVMQSNADNAVIRHDANYTNSTGGTLNGSEANNYYLTKPFVDQLKNTNDPRLPAIAVRYVGATSGSQQTAARANRTVAVQIGMPMGFDNPTIPAQATRDGLASFYDYSQLDRTRMGKLASPNYFVTFAQTQLLLAEAVQRGWTTGSAATFYNAGVTAHMQQLAEYDAGSAVAAADITAYLTANPFVPARGLEQIGTQYWIASFLNFPETWANFRRANFPVLTPNPYSGKTIRGNFINRLSYPDAENSVNRTNLDAAIQSQGLRSIDDIDTPVWWDK
ncbi:SusD/RagB family nutrient-binding outer membrane lipoprotein [Spirosoma montaniterrae]|uniref:SusD/RagB family nutrient-binding outer membrane lipoprotein n=1 Tax=Spirosoma montaniterrae TaxID=1178516 RepID=A0A1P9WZ27_9BACT|nr:SusD/RagB family nutrient-binding outer membrane lipoprotein [Spirosoma montaniterrae]AQG80632.1 hypothetical protein AWR27_15650 [Spirosoma montaniterrae]